MLFTEGTEVKAGRSAVRARQEAVRGTARRRQGHAGRGEGGVEQVPRRTWPGSSRWPRRSAIPQQDLDNAVASVEVGKANVLSAEARVESAKLDLGYCDVQAPIDRADRRQAGVGRRAWSAKGEPTLLATISQLDPDLVLLHHQRSGVSPGANARAAARAGSMDDLPVTLILADGSEHPDKGKLVFMDRAVDVKTGTLRVRAEFPNPEQAASPGHVRADQGGPRRPAGQHPGAGAGGDGTAGQELRVGHRRRQQGHAAPRQGGRNDRRRTADPGGSESRASASWSRACRKCARARRCSRRPPRRWPRPPPQAAKQAEASHAKEGEAKHGKE